MNFHFVNNILPSIYQEVIEAEKYVYTNPTICAIFSRKVMEAGVKWLYDNDDDLLTPWDQSINSLLNETTFINNVPSDIIDDLHYIRKLGNIAAHSSKSKIKDQDSIISLENLFYFFQWIANIYFDEDYSYLEFDHSILIKKEKTISAEVFKSLVEKLEDKELELKKSYEKQQKYEQDNKELLEKVKHIKEKKKKVVVIKPPKREISEAETRLRYIDLDIREAGWDPNGQNVREFPLLGMPNKSGRGKADYVLWGNNGKPFAVIEVKKTSISVEAGQRQAAIYADCLEKMYNHRPIIYYTNGAKIQLWDDKRGFPPRDVQGYMTMDQLELAIQRRITIQSLHTAIIDKKIAGRPYQEMAIRAFLEDLDKRHRKGLLVMATGTGKTRISIATVHALMQVGWVKNILFLADRDALVTQAHDKFKDHLKNYTMADLREDKLDNTSRIIFSTYQTMKNCIDKEKNDKRIFGIGHFDLIIIDEAHRSIYKKFMSIFYYFDATILGLTATPSEDVHRDTYEFFNRSTGNPTYAYSYEEAVEQGYLVPYKAVEIPTEIQLQGVIYDKLTEEEKEHIDDLFGFGPEEEVQDIPASDINKRIFNEQTTELILEYLMKKGLKIESGDKLGKTIIFARTKEHANFILKKFNQLYPEYGGKMAIKITYEESYNKEAIRNFKDPESNIQIAISVDMLDTGIDIPEVVNLIFWKPVLSKIKFWQMIGRGTRLCPDLFDKGVDKKEFYIFDIYNNFTHFELNPDNKKVNETESLSQKIFKIKIDLATEITEIELNQPDLKILKNNIYDELHDFTQNLNLNRHDIKPHRILIKSLSERAKWNTLNSDTIHKIKLNLSEFYTTLVNEWESTKRFDLLIYNFQFGILVNKETDFYQNRVMEIAHDLLKRDNIPIIKQFSKLLQQLLDIDYWKNIDILTLEKIRLNLRKLIQFIDKDKLPVQVINVYDKIINVKEFINVKSDFNTEMFTKRIAETIRTKEDWLVINKLKNNQKINHHELILLEQFLFEESKITTKEEFLQYYGNETPLGTFIRSIVGLEKNKVQEAFSEFQSKYPLSSVQSKFLEKVIDSLVLRGTLDIESLSKQPFTNIHSGGITAVFEMDQCKEIVEIIKKINDNAVA